MLVGFLMLAILVSLATAFAMPDIPQARAICSALLAIAVLATAVFASSPTIARLVRRLSLFLLVILVVPAICIALQLAPIPIRGSGNPIWATASAALNVSLADRVTVDTGITMRAFQHYSTAVALALVATVVALDKQRAWQLLTMLVSGAAIVSTYLLIQHTIGADGLSFRDTPVLIVTGAVPAVLGLTLSAAMTARVFEERRRVRQVSIRLATTLSLTVLATLLCLSAVLATGDGTGITIAALLGVGLVLVVFVIQNWFYGIWGMASVLATATVFYLAAFTLLSVRQNSDLAIALSAHHVAATERMLQNTGKAGSGAGTYVALLPIHRDVGAASSQERPTAAAAIAIEMGHTFLYGLLIVAVFSAAALFRFSLRRRRDYVYAAIGSGAAAALTMLAFVEDGILELGASLLAAAVFGLAIAQSRGDAGAATLPSQSTRSVSEPDRPGPIPAPTRTFAIGDASVRIGLGCVAVVLIAQTLWLLARPSYPRGFPVEALAADQAVRQTLLRPLSSSLRGDGDLRPGRLVSAQQPAANEAAVSKPEIGADPAALDVLARALQSSPVRGDLWLMLAALSKERKSAKYDVTALLKLSYYTAPNDFALLPLRLTVALGEVSGASEPELRELVQRDVKIVLTRHPSFRPALVAAYQSASAEGKALVEDLISERDSAALRGRRAPPSGTASPSSSRTPGGDLVR
ncbi:hypothetical protein SAMN05216330_103727 [Bradyrhizobium sp. Ghvi]|uniref:hypothetical protein n=1 Tax=Bradyrhizobium sp. Ghvi TaxID=1855319 RepID=UPI0008EFFDFE|nr:hypothetical protein [Bradyrhizobium sp. Ghvi]SFO58084.1 hypothetical protein SAMN05216330_103727 [Bradyrhizobium sp. Ghvi]